MPGAQFCALLMASAAAATATFTDSASSTATASSYTFTARSIGTASANRYIIVAAGTVNGGSTTISSITVAGNAMTQVVTAEGNNGTAWARSGLYIYGPLASGTTADVVVTFSGSTFRCGIGIWAATGLISSTATNTYSSTANPETASINVSANGFAIAYDIVNPGSNSVAWVGLGSNFNTSIDGSTQNSGASANFTSAQTALTVTGTPTSFNSAGMVVAAFH